MVWLRSAPFLRALILVCIFVVLSIETPAVHAQVTLSVDDIVDRMQLHETNQAKELKHYEAVRHYEVQYKGFGKSLVANMDVEINFDSLKGKSFRIMSQSGSRLLCDKVLKRAVDSEEEASKDKASTALNSANYRFELAGTDQLGGKPTYILRVDPLKETKFLYRGRVWVDAADFAVIKIEAEPARNPSFWISSTHIESTNSKTDGVWLPQKNRSESKIRIGGTAVLTIDYGTYQISLTGKLDRSANDSVPTATPTTEAAF